jgi:hypothetical protein
MTEEVGAPRRQRWWTCGRCGINFPQDQVVMQNGLVVCLKNCRDEPGARVFREQLHTPYEREDEPLSNVDEDL